MDSSKDLEDNNEGNMESSEEPERIDALPPGEGNPWGDGGEISASGGPHTEDSGSLHFAISLDDVVKIQRASQDQPLSSPNNRVILNIPHSPQQPSLVDSPPLLSNITQHATDTSSSTPPQTASIPLATPIFINERARDPIPGTNSSSNILKSLHSCAASMNPLPIISSVRKDLYGLPSVVKRLMMQKRLREHEGCVNCINFSWQGDLLASGSDDLHVVQWDWRRGRMVSKFETGHVANVFQVRH